MTPATVAARDTKKRRTRSNPPLAPAAVQPDNGRFGNRRCRPVVNARAVRCIPTRCRIWGAAAREDAIYAHLLVLLLLAVPGLLLAGAVNALLISLRNDRQAPCC
jgi:hypothetical protein